MIDSLLTGDQRLTIITRIRSEMKLIDGSKHWNRAVLTHMKAKLEMRLNHHALEVTRLRDRSRQDRFAQELKTSMSREPRSTTRHRSTDDIEL